MSTRIEEHFPKFMKIILDTTLYYIYRDYIRYTQKSYIRYNLKCEKFKYNTFK